ncbi:MAG: sialate O-acetylesterase [Tunicatimonas sp.]
MLRTFRLFFLLINGLGGTLSAQSLIPAPFFTNHAVLQRNQPITVFGRAAPGAIVSASLDGQTAAAYTEQSGSWSVTLPARRAGGPYELTITDGTDSVRCADVLLGDVWIASGQSNMQYKMREGVLNTEAEVQRANYPNLRYLEVTKRPASSPTPLTDTLRWLVSTPDNVGEFSAVAYFFAQSVQRETDVPIGIIDATWGGSTIEAWMSPEALARLPHLPGPEVPEVRSGEYTLEAYNAINETRAARAVQLTDSSFVGLTKGATKPSLDDADWAVTNLTGWNAPDRQIYWFRKSFQLANVPRDSLQLNLGLPGSQMHAYLNGELVLHRRIDPAEVTLAPKLFQQGNNQLVFRLANPWWNPYVLAGEKAALRRMDGSVLMPLDSGWRFSNALEERVPPFYDLQHVPSGLYHGMVSPLLELGIAGVIWYQGESNGNDGIDYRQLFPTLISEWRIQFRQGYFPFLFVQLANFGEPTQAVEAQGWPWLREAQAQALYLPSTGMATAIDVGDPYDIHPKDKRTVGERLALSALAIAYGKDTVHIGPTYRSHQIAGNRMTVRFGHADGLRTADDKDPKGFSLAGSDRVFYPATASISGPTVTVTSDSVATPVAVRYGWAKNPVVNLYNRAKLPAVPFRTDNWSPAAE